MGKIEVFCDTAQRTAFNFLALCASGCYDGTSFHRNMKGFMIQVVPCPRLRVICYLCCANNQVKATHCLLVVFFLSLSWSVQGGDPTGTGKGGDSIWGGKFQDEFHPD